MQLMRSHVDGIPPENVNIPVPLFARGWFAAEQLHDDRVARGASDWYDAAVVVTCRWLANATVRPETGPWYSERAPMTHRRGMTHPEYVQEEAFEAQSLWGRRNEPSWLLARPGWLEGVAGHLRLGLVGDAGSPASRHGRSESWVAGGAAGQHGGQPRSL